MKKIFTLSFPVRNILWGFILTLASLAPLASYSQAALSARIINFPDTVYLQSTYSITIAVKNTGNASYTDTTIQVNYATDSLFNPKLLGTISVAPPLNPGDSVFLFKNLTIDSSVFGGPGIHIVVVWPTGSSRTADSVWTSVFVIDTLSANNIPEPYNTHGIKIYPNPASSVLFIESNSSKNTAERVRISDILGKVILDIQAASTAHSASENEKIQVNLSPLGLGIYMLEIMDNSGQRHRMKFIKSPL